MKKTILIFLLLLCYGVQAQVNIYWRNESPNGNWEWGSSCDGGNDGNWYYASPWGGNRKRPDCYSYHYLHFDNNNQTGMNLNSGNDFSVNKIIFDAGASNSRTINSDAFRKIFFKNPGAKLENYSTVNHTFNADLSLDTDVEINPINGNLSVNTINTFGYTINVYGNNGKVLYVLGTVNGAGGMYIKQNSTVVLSGNNTYTGNTVVEAGTLQLNNDAGAILPSGSITVHGQGALKVSKNQTLANLTLYSGATVIIDAGAVLTITGSLNCEGIIHNNGTLTLKGGDRNFPGALSSITAMNDLTINSEGTVTLNKDMTPLNLSVISGTLNLGNYTANGQEAGGRLAVLNNAHLKISGTNTLPANYSVHAVSDESTIEYSGTIQEIKPLNSGQSYGNLMLSGSGQKTMPENILVAHNLDLTAGAGLRVQTGKTLYVGGKIHNWGSAANFVIENNGTLLQGESTTINSNEGGITAIKNSNPLYRLDYTLWSSPVSGQTLGDFSPETVSGRFYEYKYDFDATANANVEQYFTVAPSTVFAPAKGYLIRMPNANSNVQGYNTGTEAYSFEGTFEGVPHDGTITIPTSTGSNYTVVGNPYPSPISVEDFFTVNNGVMNASSGIYFWRKRNNTAGSSYATLTLAAYTFNAGLSASAGGGAEQSSYYSGDVSTWLISQGQGFFVKNIPGSAGTITFTNAMRRPSAGINQAFFRTATAINSRLWLNLTHAQGGFSQAAIAYIDNATTGLDYGYDGQQLREGASVSLYSVAANTNLAVQARPAFTADDTVQLGFAVTAAGQYTVNLDHVDGIFAQGQNIYLKDNFLNVVTNIETAYTFASEAGTFNNRFEIVYATQTLNNNLHQFNAENIVLFKDGDVINIDAGKDVITSVTVFDIHGRKLYNKANVGATRVMVNGLPVQQQMLIVEINTLIGKTTKKIVF